MSRLIDRNGPRDDGWVVVDDGESAPAADAKVLVPYSAWLGSREHWRAHPGSVGVVLSPGNDPATLAGDLDRLELIAVEFPTFNDGRGFSIARLLRERLHYRGELRAVGDIMRDQMFYLARCGFDSFALRDDQDVEQSVRALADFSEVYQAAVDRGPLFERRHATPAAR
jgi:uncharacterized protein (DUF934 family)